MVFEPFDGPGYAAAVALAKFSPGTWKPARVARSAIARDSGPTRCWRSGTFWQLVGHFGTSEVLIDDRPVPYHARTLAAPPLVSPPTLVLRESDIDRDLRKLEANLRKLEGGCNVFFAGQLPRPPWETRARVEAMVKRLDRAGQSRARSRAVPLHTLQARFVTFADLWDRGLRAREEGRPGPSAVKGPGVAARRQGGSYRVRHRVLGPRERTG